MKRLFEPAQPLCRTFPPPVCLNLSSVYGAMQVMDNLSVPGPFSSPERAAKTSLCLVTDLEGFFLYKYILKAQFCFFI